MWLRNRSEVLQLCMPSYFQNACVPHTEPHPHYSAMGTNQTPACWLSMQCMLHMVHQNFIMTNCLPQQQLARSLFRPASLPSVQCPYQAADSCTGFQPQSCCERLSVSGSVPSVTLHTLSILLAMICAVMALQQPTGTECLQSVHISYVDFVRQLVKQHAILLYINYSVYSQCNFQQLYSIERQIIPTQLTAVLQQAYS